MSLKNYPAYTCKGCALAHEGKIPDLYIVSVHTGICDVCNEWKEVTNSSDYSYPKFTKKRDLDKIYSQLMRAMFDFYKNKDFDSALEINYEINEILHEMYERGVNDGTTLAISRKSRRPFRKRSEISQRAI